MRHLFVLPGKPTGAADVTFSMTADEVSRLTALAVSRGIHLDTLLYTALDTLITTAAEDNVDRAVDIVRAEADSELASFRNELSHQNYLVLCRFINEGRKVPAVAHLRDVYCTDLFAMMQRVATILRYYGPERPLPLL